MTPFPGEATTRSVLREGRAQPLPPEDRRDSILDAAVPLFMAQGADVTTRQIAEAAGIAEGTIFRVFEDKQALIAAVVERFMDPAEAMGAISAIDESLPLETKLRMVIEIVTARFEGVMGIMSALGLREPPRPHSAASFYPAGPLAAEALFERHRDELRVDVALVVHLIRMLCLSRSIPPIAGIRVVTDDELVDLVLHGVLKEGR